jgi:hypothetical protein
MSPCAQVEQCLPSGEQMPGRGSPNEAYRNFQNNENRPKLQIFTGHAGKITQPLARFLETEE